MLDPDRVRQDFRLLQAPEDERVVYLDNACMTLKPESVVQAMVEYYHEYPACGERSVHRLSNRVTIAVDEARAKMAALVGAKDPAQVAFQKNTTEAINQVCWGLPLTKGDVVLTSDKEHNSNLVPWKRRAQVDGIRHAWFPTTHEGTFDEEAFKQTVSEHRKDLKLVSVVHTSNLDGQTFPVALIAEVAHDAGAKVLVDGAQSVPHMPIDVEAIGVDWLAWSVHKMMGPTGVGCLWGSPDALATLEPRFLGGNTVADSRLDGFELLEPPHTLEAGLQDYAGIIGAGAAADHLRTLDPAAVHAHERKLNARLDRRLRDAETVTIHGPEDPGLRGGITPFTMAGLDSHDVALYLDEAARVCLRSGAHCVHGFMNARGAKGWARASLYAYNTEAEVDLLADTLATLKGHLEKTTA